MVGVTQGSIFNTKLFTNIKVPTSKRLLVTDINSNKSTAKGTTTDTNNNRNNNSINNSINIGSNHRSLEAVAMVPQ